MYLTRIEMNGFKSFNTKKELIIKEGITGVVGPNGSGKSNIADAIRWVLGEQSSKNLRGSKMEDVIFNGTEDFGRKGFCEVELVFDNTDSKVNSDYTELSVRRKMYRSGESEYYLNGSSCRLKDIVELFRDTGIGKEGYSIIGQGRIDEILNSKPSARRRVFEEAAGIMKYRARKEEAERNLTKTRDNLVRIDDIIRELELQVDPLREQMDTAKRYLSLSDRLKSLDVNLYLYNHDHIIDRINKTEIQQKENAENAEDCSRKLQESALKLSELKNRLGEVQQIIESSTSDISDMGSEQAELRGEYNLLLEREKHLASNKTELSESVEANLNRIAEAEKSLAEISGRIEKLNSELDKYAVNIQELESSQNAIIEELNKNDNILVSCRNEVDQARSDLDKCRFAISENTVRVQSIQDQISQISSSDFSALEECRKLESDIDSIGRDIESKQSEKQELIGKSNNVSSEIASLKTETDKDVVALSELKIEISNKESSVQLLSGLKDNYEGYANGVRALLSDNSSGARLYGTVADVINVPKQYELAIETLLGNTLQNVVTQSEADAKKAIGYLRREKQGRVTFLPVESLQVKYLTSSEKEDMAGSIIGVASELVECSDTVRPAVDFLLGRTVVVENLDTAFDVMRMTGYGVRTVTLKGDIVRPGGSVTGGSTDKNVHGFLKRNRMIEELSSQLEADRKKLDILEKECAERKKQLAEKQGEREQLIADIQKSELECAGKKADLKSCQDQYDLIMSQNRASVEHLNKLEEDLQTVSDVLASDKNELQAKEDRFSKAVSMLEQCEQENKENSQNASGTLLEIQRAELDRQEVLRVKEKLLAESEHLRLEISRNKESNTIAENKIMAIDSELDGSLAQSRKDVLEKLDEITLVLKTTSDNVQNIFREKDELNAEIEKAAETNKKLSDRQGELIEEKYSLSAQLEKFRLKQETVEERIWNDYELTYNSALEYRTDDFSYNSGIREIDEIREKLHGIGVVNPNAIEDFARVNERLQDMLVQKQDLEKASSDLKEVITSLLSDMENCFNDKFDLINSRFQEIFRTLFGGGRAELIILNDSEEASESGIDIIAEPPGKKLQSLSLLSGGEKALCAIALLFAMLNINPSPICLLDEIDAPLDDANLERFSEYLKNLSKDLQFIVITHRKPTMAVCDTLYGIAMRKKGVSEILSVDLK